MPRKSDGVVQGESHPSRHHALWAYQRPYLGVTRAASGKRTTVHAITIPCGQVDRRFTPELPFWPHHRQEPTLDRGRSRLHKLHRPHILGLPTTCSVKTSAQRQVMKLW